MDFNPRCQLSNENFFATKLGHSSIEIQSCSRLLFGVSDDTFSRQNWRTLWKRRIVVDYPGDVLAPGRCRTGSGEEVFGTTGSRTVVERNLPVTFTSVCWRWATKMSTTPAFKVNQGQLSGHSALSSRLESQLPTRCPSRNLMFSIL